MDRERFQRVARRTGRRCADVWKRDLPERSSRRWPGKSSADPPSEILALPGESIDSPALSPDGRKLVLVRLSVDSDIRMVSAPSSETSTGNGF